MLFLDIVAALATPSSYPDRGGSGPGVQGLLRPPRSSVSHSTNLAAQLHRQAQGCVRDATTIPTWVELPLQGEEQAWGEPSERGVKGPTGGE